MSRQLATLESLIQQLQRPSQTRMLLEAREALDFTPTQMALALGVSYDTFKQWQSGRRTMPKVAWRCVELLRRSPKTARRLANGAPLMGGGT